MTFQPGHSGGGNRRGKRDKITQAFLNDLELVWREDGAAALKAAAKDKPAEFAKMVASLLPRQVEIERPLADMNDDELAQLVDTIREALAAAKPPGSGAEVPAEPQPPSDVSSLH